MSAMQKLSAWILFIVVLCLFLLYGAYRALRHEEARPATPPTAAWLLHHTPVNQYPKPKQHAI
jgi:hypothetical protein